VKRVFAKLRQCFRGPSTGLGVVLGIIGLTVVLTGYNVFVDHTNTMDFCISCHEMEKTVYQEYKKSLHYQNRVGVRAACPDCHVPRGSLPKFAVKVVAAKDVLHHVLGTIDTPEKFEAQRLVMAKRVWAKMEASESRECRACHDLLTMKLDEQGRRGQKKHPEAIKEGKHCINCHKGVVHEMPKGFEGE
jgi:nitrate/TMAO reductase-like tetraheme cytochrome c subunit